MLSLVVYALVRKRLACENLIVQISIPSGVRYVPWNKSLMVF